MGISWGVIRFGAVMSDGERGKDKSQDKEYVCLNEANEELEDHKER